jgi:hypothetical protein
MDESESTPRLGAMQSAPRVLQRRDGRYVVAYDDGGITRIGDLHIIPDRTALDRFKDALSTARNALEHAVRSAVGGAIASASHTALEDAFAAYDFNTFYALEALREALKP